ncbi:hypothetical protein STANM309S_04416 [Streptomyces tanashiensis]
MGLRCTASRSYPADPAQSGLAQGVRAARQADAVGGEGQFGDGVQGVEAGHEAGQAATQERFAAGQPYGGGAQAPDGDADEAYHLVVGEQLGPGQPVEALGRHAVRAAQVAAVGERDPQIRVDPAETVRRRGGVRKRIHDPITLGEFSAQVKRGIPDGAIEFACPPQLPEP